MKICCWLWTDISTELSIITSRSHFSELKTHHCMDRVKIGVMHKHENTHLSVWTLIYAFIRLHIAHSELWDSSAINSLLLTIISAILCSIVLSKPTNFSIHSGTRWLVSMLNKQIPDVDLCGTPLRTSMHLSDHFSPKLLFIELFSLVLSALLFPEPLSFFKA